MEETRQPRWRRREARLRSETRRVLAVGAVLGLGAGLAAQVVVGTPDGGIEWLVRGSFLIPVVVYALWWLVGPGIGIDERSGQDAMQQVVTSERIERISTVFDEAAVPRARRGRIVEPEDLRNRTELRASIRREQSPQVDPSSFGVSRPTRPEQRSSDSSAR